MEIAVYLNALREAEERLAEGFERISAGHPEEPDVASLCERLAAQCRSHAGRLAPFTSRYGEQRSSEPDRLRARLALGPRKGGVGLLRDLHDLYLMATDCDISWTLVGQAGKALRDTDLLGIVEACEAETSLQLKWLKTRMKTAAPQALVVA